MRYLTVDLLRIDGSRLAFAFALIAATFAAPPPARAQDLFGFFRMLLEPSGRRPAYSPYHYRPRAHRRATLRRARIARAAEAPEKPPLKPRAPGEFTNPVPALLADGTLRRGDIVMFPDGPRVFVGRPRGQHALEDFEPVSPDTKALPQSTRKLLAQMRPGWHGAWAAEDAGGRVAAAADVTTTGSIRRRR